MVYKFRMYREDVFKLEDGTTGTVAASYDIEIPFVPSADVFFSLPNSDAFLGTFRALKSSVCWSVRHGRFEAYDDDSSGDDPIEVPNWSDVVAVYVGCGWTVESRSHNEEEYAIGGTNVDTQNPAEERRPV